MALRPYTPNLPVGEANNPLESDVDKLNFLLRMEHNAVSGYEHAIDDVDDDTLKSHFETYRQAHQERGTRLSNMITAMNGKPVEGGSIAGALHRNWLDVKAAAAADTAEAVLKAVSFGERNLDEAYEDLLENGALQSEELHATVARMHKGVHALMENTERLTEIHANS